MTTEHLVVAGDGAGEPSKLTSVGVVKSILTRITAWGAICADYWEAAATYEQLAGLSDAGLHRRGLSRETLARDVSETSDRSRSLEPKTLAFW
jgi:hypothetical protein